MHRHDRCVLSLVGLSVLAGTSTGLLAQGVLQVTSVSIQGALDSASACPGITNDPVVTRLTQNNMTPVDLTSRATSDSVQCQAQATTRTLMVLSHFTNGSLQITGSGTVGTSGAVNSVGPGTFAWGDATSDTRVEVEFALARWCNLAFAGTMTVNASPGAGDPANSSAHLSQSWDLITPSGHVLASREVALGSGDALPTVQDVNYSTILAGPGTYTLHLTVTGGASGIQLEQGVTGWTCMGSFGLTVSAQAARCAADYDENGIVDTRDLFEFLNAYFLEATDFNQDDTVDSRDLFDYLNAYLEGGCG